VTREGHAGEIRICQAKHDTKSVKSPPNEYSDLGTKHSTFSPPNSRLLPTLLSPQAVGVEVAAAQDGGEVRANIICGVRRRTVKAGLNIVLLAVMLWGSPCLN